MTNFKDDQIKLLKPDYRYTDSLLKIILRNQKNFKKWLPWANQKFDEKLMHKFMEYYIDGFKKNREYRYFIYHVQEDSIIGSITLRNISLTNQSADLGYWLDEKYVGNGYIVKSFEILNKKIASLKIKKIYAKTHDGNYKSIKTLHRMKFQEIYNSHDDALLFQKVLH